MQLRLENFRENPTVFMRSCGYSFDRQENNEWSFVHRLSGQDYPRFHAYVHQQENSLVINLHLDQKKPSYGVNHAHSGEYDGPLVLNEGERIKLFHR
jgi:hypothetical protein